MGTYWYQDGGSSQWSRLAPVHLPTLSGREPLGFLAALGVISTLDHRLETPSPLLSWCPQSHHAIVHSVFHSTDEIVKALTDVIAKRIAPGQVLPGTVGFPPRRKPGAPDPLRITPEQYGGRSLRTQHEGGPHAEQWLRHTIDGGETDANGHCKVTPYIYTQGRQTIGQFYWYPLEAVRRDPAKLLTEALTDWRRDPQVDSWGLDHRSGGTVPGATWLATQSLYYLPCASLWHRLGNDDFMVWPLWGKPLGGLLGEISSLLGYLSITTQREGHSIWVSDQQELFGEYRSLRNKDQQLFAFYAAGRRPAEHHPAALTPVPVRYGNGASQSPSRRWRRR